MNLCSDQDGVYNALLGFDDAVLAVAVVDEQSFTVIEKAPLDVAKEATKDVVIEIHYNVKGWGQ